MLKTQRLCTFSSDIEIVNAHKLELVLTDQNFWPFLLYTSKCEIDKTVCGSPHFLLVSCNLFFLHSIRIPLFFYYSNNFLHSQFCIYFILLRLHFCLKILSVLPWKQVPFHNLLQHFKSLNVFTFNKRMNQLCNNIHKLQQSYHLSKR